MTDFEWDGVKAATNFQRHGISFDTAAQAFRDPFAVEWIDAPAGRNASSSSASPLGSWSTSPTPNAATPYHLISARRATRHEQDHYLRQSAP